MTRKYLTETLKQTLRNNLLEGEIGYDRMSDEEKYKFHMRMIHRIERNQMHGVDPDSLHPEARKAIMDEYMHHVGKSADLLRKMVSKK